MKKVLNLCSPKVAALRRFCCLSLLLSLVCSLGAVQASASNAAPGAYVDGVFYDYAGLVELIHAPRSSDVLMPMSGPGTPQINWTPDTPIAFRHPVGSGQLNAQAVDPVTLAEIRGTYVYDPALGTFLAPDTYSLSLIFVPEDLAEWEIKQVARTVVVSQRVPNIVWADASFNFGVPLHNGILNAVAYEPEYPANPNPGGWAASDGSSVVIPGMFTYSAALGDYLDAGSHTLSVTFVPDTAVIAPGSGTAAITVTVAKAPTTVTWAAPASEVYEFVFAAGVSPLNAEVVYDRFSIDGSGNLVATPVVTPAMGSIAYTIGGDTVVIGSRPNAGTYTIDMDFTGTANFEDADDDVSFTVDPKPVVITFSLEDSYITIEDPVTLTATTNANPLAANGDDVPLELTFSMDPVVTWAEVTSAGVLTFPGWAADGDTEKPFTVRVDFAGSSNYVAATATASSEVEKAGPSVAFGQPENKTWGCGVTEWNLTTYDTNNLNPVWSVTSGPGTLSGNTLTATGAGSIVLRAEIGETMRFKAATEDLPAITVSKGTPVIAATWTGNIDFCTDLEDILDSVSVTCPQGGTFFDAGRTGDLSFTIGGDIVNDATILQAGSYTLVVNFTPTGATAEDWNAAVEVTVDFSVNSLDPDIDWTPAFTSIVYGDDLDDVLNATFSSPVSCSLEGAFVYTVDGDVITTTSILNAGTHTITGTFTPSGANAGSFNSWSETRTLEVTPFPLVITPRAVPGDLTWFRQLGEPIENSLPDPRVFEFAFDYPAGAPGISTSVTLVQGTADLENLSGDEWTLSFIPGESIPNTYRVRAEFVIDPAVAANYDVATAEEQEVRIRRSRPLLLPVPGAPSITYGEPIRKWFDQTFESREVIAAGDSLWVRQAAEVTDPTDVNDPYYTFLELDTSVWNPETGNPAANLTLNDLVTGNSVQPTDPTELDQTAFFVEYFNFPQTKQYLDATASTAITVIMFPELSEYYLNVSRQEVIIVDAADLDLDVTGLNTTLTYQDTWDAMLSGGSLSVPFNWTEIDNPFGATIEDRFKVLEIELEGDGSDIGIFGDFGTVMFRIDGGAWLSETDFRALAPDADTYDIDIMFVPAAAPGVTIPASEFGTSEPIVFNDLNFDDSPVVSVTVTVNPFPIVIGAGSAGSLAGLPNILATDTGFNVADYFSLNVDPDLFAASGGTVDVTVTVNDGIVDLGAAPDFALAPLGWAPDGIDAKDIELTVEASATSNYVMVSVDSNVFTQTKPTPSISASAIPNILTTDDGPDLNDFFNTVPMGLSGLAFSVTQNSDIVSAVPVLDPLGWTPDGICTKTVEVEATLPESQRWTAAAPVTSSFTITKPTPVIELSGSLPAPMWTTDADVDLTAPFSISPVVPVDFAISAGAAYVDASSFDAVNPVGWAHDGTKTRTIEITVSAEETTLYCAAADLVVSFTLSKVDQVIAGLPASPVLATFRDDDLEFCGVVANQTEGPQAGQASGLTVTDSVANAETPGAITADHGACFGYEIDNAGTANIFFNAAGDMLFMPAPQVLIVVEVAKFQYAVTDFTWSPADVTYPVALNCTGDQFNATGPTDGIASGSFSYTPAEMVFAAGPLDLTATWTPADTRNYESVTLERTITVNSGDPVLAWTVASPITWPDALDFTGANAPEATEDDSLCGVDGDPIAGSWSYFYRADGDTTWLAVADLTDPLLPGDYDLQARFLPADTSFAEASITADLTVEARQLYVDFTQPVFGEIEQFICLESQPFYLDNDGVRVDVSGLTISYTAVHTQGTGATIGTVDNGSFSPDPAGSCVLFTRRGIATLTVATDADPRFLAPIAEVGFPLSRSVTINKIPVQLVWDWKLPGTTDDNIVQGVELTKWSPSVTDNNTAVSSQVPSATAELNAYAYWTNELGVVAFVRGTYAYLPVEGAFFTGTGTRVVELNFLPTDLVRFTAPSLQKTIEVLPAFQASFDQWADAAGLTPGPGGSFDPLNDSSGNGVADVVAFAMGLDPLSGVRVDPIISIVDGKLRITYWEAIAAQSVVSFTIEGSSDLAGFTAIDPADLTEISRVLDNGYETVTVEIDDPAVSFLRIEVSY